MWYGCRLGFPLCAVGDAEAVLGFADGRFEVLTTKHCTSDREYVQSVKRMKTPFKCPCSFVALPLKLENYKSKVPKGVSEVLDIYDL